jgi:hypothetical protein
MPAYYEIGQPITTNAAAATLSSGPHLTLKTGTNVRAHIMGLYAGSRGATAGGGFLRAHTLATATSSSGTAVTPAKRNPNSAAATTSAMSSQTGPGTTRTHRILAAFAQTGGQGGWVAPEPDAAVQLLAGGGANGNLDVDSIANGASQLVDMLIEFAEL